MPGWVTQTTWDLFWEHLKEEHGLLSLWYCYDEGASRPVRAIAMFVENMWMMCAEAICYFYFYDPTLIATCPLFENECDCLALGSVMMDLKIHPNGMPACEWKLKGHPEQFDPDKCSRDAKSGGACAFREPNGDDPFIFVFFLLLVTTTLIPAEYMLEYLFDSIILAAPGRCRATTTAAIATRRTPRSMRLRTASRTLRRRRRCCRSRLSRRSRSSKIKAIANAGLLRDRPDACDDQGRHRDRAAPSTSSTRRRGERGNEGRQYEAPPALPQVPAGDRRAGARRARRVPPAVEHADEHAIGAHLLSAQCRAHRAQDAPPAHRQARGGPRRGDDGLTPLHVCCRYRINVRARVLAQLLDAYPTGVECASKEGWLPAHYPRVTVPIRLRHARSAARRTSRAPTARGRRCVAPRARALWGKTCAHANIPTATGAGDVQTSSATRARARTAGGATRLLPPHLCRYCASSTR